jgi:uncharacterized membrane protein
MLPRAPISEWRDFYDTEGGMWRDFYVGEGHYLQMDIMLERPITVGEETFIRGPHLRMDVYSMLQIVVVGW